MNPHPALVAGVVLLLLEFLSGRILCLPAQTTDTALMIHQKDRHQQVLLGDRVVDGGMSHTGDLPRMVRDQCIKTR